LKQLLEDAQNNVLMNKNMIEIIVDHQDQSASMIKDQESSQDARSEVIIKMNEENTLLHKQINDLRRKMESLNTDVLLKN